jgi:hypothetical protein
MSKNYSKQDENIDKYLGTHNLRPGPPRKLVNHYINKDIEQKGGYKIEPNRVKINFSSYSANLSKDSIKWEE